MSQTEGPTGKCPLITQLHRTPHGIGLYSKRDIDEWRKRSQISLRRERTNVIAHSSRLFVLIRSRFTLRWLHRVITA